jgi:hypothetical protein
MCADLGRRLRVVIARTVPAHSKEHRGGVVEQNSEVKHTTGNETYHCFTVGQWCSDDESEEVGSKFNTTYA